MAANYTSAPSWSVVAALLTEAALPSSGSALLLTSPSPSSNSSNIVDNKATTAIGALILSAVFLLGVPGNLFIIWSILARTRKHSVTTLLILNLACADGSLMALTPFFVAYLVLKTWVFGEVMCKVLFYLCLANMYASIHVITLMSLHRLLAVTRPHHVAAIASRRAVIRLLAALWLLVLAISIPAVIFRQKKAAYHRTGEPRWVCEASHKHNSYVVLQYTMELVLGFLIPYPVIVGSYICILRRLRRTKFRRRIRSEKMILAIVTTFCVFWLPYHVINMVQVAAALCPDHYELKKHLDDMWQNWRPVTSSIAFISSCANPVLYVFAGKSYIRRDGLAFMARLFEGTALDSGTRKSRQNRMNSIEKKKEAEGEVFKEQEMDSVTPTDSSSNGKCVKNVS